MGSIQGISQREQYAYRKINQMEREEINKDQIKKDIEEWAKLMGEANEKLIVVYDSLNEIYKEVSK